MTTFKRPSKSNNLTIGIVGLPNTGKSTLYNFLTKNKVPSENYPFCTIDPSFGKVIINDTRINYLKTLYTPKNVINAYLGITDIAGLVKGASENFGLGNKFLSHIRNVDAIFHVIRCFDNPEIVHVEDSVDPIRDLKIVNDELRFKDIEIMNKIKDKLNKEIRGKSLDKKLKDKLVIVDKVLERLNFKWVNQFEWNDDEISVISQFDLLTCKNVVYLANVSEDEYVKKKVNKHLRALINYLRETEGGDCKRVGVVDKDEKTVGSKVDQTVGDEKGDDEKEDKTVGSKVDKNVSNTVDKDDKNTNDNKTKNTNKTTSSTVNTNKTTSSTVNTNENTNKTTSSTVNDNKTSSEKICSPNIIVFSAVHEDTSSSDISSSSDIRTPFINKLVKKGYEILDLINFFTVGKDEVRSWTIKRGTLAPQAGAVIHSDFMNYFIMAEVMSFNDLKEAGSEVEVKNRGKYHQRGKLYEVNDGDIIIFKSNPPKSVKKK